MGSKSWLNVLNILIKSCTFQKSKACAVFLDNAIGNITIEKSNFVYNIADTNCAGLQILYGVNISSIILNGSIFYSNGHLDSPYSTCVNGNEEESYPIKVYIVIHNTTFINNTRGLYLDAYSQSVTKFVCPAWMLEITLKKVFLYLELDTKNSHQYFSLSFSTFVGNANSFTVFTPPGDLTAMIEIVNSTFKYNNLIRKEHSFNYGGALTIVSSASKTKLNLSNCNFSSNVDGAIGIDIAKPALISKCPWQNIIFSNVLIYNTTTHDNGTDASVCITTKDTSNQITFEGVMFQSNSNNKRGGGVLHVKINHGCNIVDQCSISNLNLVGCTFKNNKANDSVIILFPSNNDIVETVYQIEITNTTFDGNVNEFSVVYFYADRIIHQGNFKLTSSNFTYNIGAAIKCDSLSHFQLLGNVHFENNMADYGAALYIKRVIEISVQNDSSIHFINNSALKGGAMYINVPQYCSNNGNIFSVLSTDANVNFDNNRAELAGSSIYLDIPKTCNVICDNSSISFLNIPSLFKCSQSPDIVTPPSNIVLNSSEIIESKNVSSHYLLKVPKMLGESMNFTASVFDFFNNAAEPTVFQIKCDKCEGNYLLSKNQTVMARNSLQELKVFPKNPQDIENITYAKIKFTSVLSPMYKQVQATLEVMLSPCLRGHKFDNSATPPQCVCYSASIIRCNKNHSEISIGYWVGTVSNHYTVSFCPSNFCNLSERKEYSPGFIELPNKENEQCSSYREGVACGECISGYTLAYDSPKCISDDKCSPGITVLVVLLTIIYWVLIVAVVFAVMHFNNRVLSGCVYGILYYYSIVDILIGNTLHIHESTFQAIAIISSFAKLKPQAFGRLCFVKGLSGIDQHFIHYSHAVAVSLITLAVVIAARHSLRISRYISRCIIRVICVLILLSYTSLASTSLQLLRPLTFEDSHVKEIRTYLSPELKYLKNQHLAYALVAFLCEALLIGLILLLLFEPQIRKKISLTRIKPLLDQFQGCFKEKHRWFAAYYLICRQVIISIVYVGNKDYYNMLFYLQSICIIIAMIHFWFQPYKSQLLNALDGILLFMLVMVVSLNVFSVSLSSAVEGLALALVLSPLLIYIFVAVCKLIGKYPSKKSLLHRFRRNEADALNEFISRYTIHTYRHSFYLIYSSDHFYTIIFA